MLANVRRAHPIVVAGTAATLVTVAGYAIGSIQVANRVARRYGVDDLRDVGDRNPGYWNARETIGARSAAPVFAGDVAKGVAAAGLGATAGRLTGVPWLASLGGGAAMVGHSFPATAGFRGGRSVLTFVGTSLVTAPTASAAAIGVCGLGWAATGRFDRAARVGVATFPFLQLAIDGPRRTAVSGLLLTFVGARFLTLGS